MKKTILFLFTMFNLVLANTPNECDILASSPMDPKKPTSVKGVFPFNINNDKTIKWCIKAVKDFPNEPRYKYQLGRAHKDLNLSNKYILESANQGYSTAQYDLGLMYKNGKGIQQDYAQAFKWLMASAVEGNKDAQLEIGDMYYFGQWATKNYKKSFKWSMKSAKQGNARAQHAIGGMYFYGRGVKKDYKKAFEWFMKSARNDYVDVQHIIGYIVILNQTTT